MSDSAISPSAKTPSEKNSSVKPQPIPVEFVSDPTEIDNSDIEKENVSPENGQQETDSPSPFVEFNLTPQVIQAIETSGYTTPTGIQSETIPLVLKGRDLIGQAETGSGKTAAFALPLLSKIDTSKKTPQVLVLAPTRELAIQVTASFQKYGASIPGFRAVTIYGGQSYETQLRAIRRGVQVVVGTPGRVMDHLRQKTLDLSQLKTFVLDEADEMLRMGFIDDVEWTMEQLPAKRQIVLFSATMPQPIRNIANKFLKQPVSISIKTKTGTADSIEQTCIHTPPREKFHALVQLLESEPTEGVIVFVKTRNTTVMIADKLSQRGFSASPLNGDIPQNQRERTIEQLKKGRINVLVATDVAARGLDVQRISHVINYDFPHDTEAYVHRVGRTGRAGRAGAAVLFVEPKERGKLGRLQKSTNQKIKPHNVKTIDEINAIRIARFKQLIGESVSDAKQMKFFTRMVSEYQTETGVPMEQVAAGLAIMAQGDVPLLLKELAKSKSNWKTKDGKRDASEMATFRIEVGRDHGVKPGNIVGAITNEADLDYTSIGKIRLFDKFSTIDLPSKISASVLEELAGVEVSGQRLQIARSRNSPGRSRSKKNNGSTKFAKQKSSKFRKNKSASNRY